MIKGRAVGRWIVAAVSLLLAVTASGSGTQWTGYWGGWKGLPSDLPSYPEAEEYAPGRWIDGPVRVALVHTDVHVWTAEETAVARAAIEAWNDTIDRIRDELDVAPWSPERLLRDVELLCEVSEASDGTDGAEIYLRWESPDTFFKDWGDADGDGVPFSAAGAAALYLPHRVIPFLGDPCADLEAAGSPVGPGTIVLNRQNPVGWYVDLTPEDDNHFEAVGARLCGTQSTTLRAVRGSPARGRHDLYTVILHELGHALGLIHSGGCDGDLFKGGPRDDDGRLMWEGYLEDRRSLESHFVAGERRHVTDRDREMLKLYQTAAAIAWMQDTDSEGLCAASLGYGRLLLESEHFGNARDWFGQVIADCADPLLVGWAEEGIIQVEVAETAALPETDRDEIPPFPGRHFPGLGTPQVLVGNQTGYELVVSYVGPVVRRVILPAGAEQILVLPAGTYEVMAVIGDSVTPFYGVVEFLVDWRYLNDFAVLEQPAS